MDIMLVALIGVALFLVGGYFLVSKANETVQTGMANAGVTAAKVIDSAGNRVTKTFDDVYNLSITTAKKASDMAQGEVQEWVSLPMDTMYSTYKQANSIGWDVRNGVTSGVNSLLDYTSSAQVNKTINDASTVLNSQVTSAQNTINNMITQGTTLVTDTQQQLSQDSLWGFNLGALYSGFKSGSGALGALLPA